MDGNYTPAVSEAYPANTRYLASAIFSIYSLSKLMMTARDMSSYLAVKTKDGREASFPLHVWRAYNQIGSILCCGSMFLESAAAMIHQSILTEPEQQDLMSIQVAELDISREQVIELMVRRSLFENFESFVGDVLPAGVRRKLKDLLMDVVYPSPR